MDSLAGVIQEIGDEMQTYIAIVQNGMLGKKNRNETRRTENSTIVEFL